MAFNNVNRPPVVRERHGAPGTERTAPIDANMGPDGVGARPAVPGGRVGVVAIVRLRRHEPPDDLLEALLGGGVTAVEVTLPTPGSVGAVRRWAQDGRAVVGVGTVRTARDAIEAIEAGARFLVTPTTRPEVLQAAAERRVPVIAGAMTPTEIDIAWDAGAAAVKVFPVSALGGPGFVRAVREPLDDVLLLPTGGVDEAATEEFARAGCIGVGVGGGLVAEHLVADRDWPALTARAESLVAAWQRGAGGRG